MDLCPLHGKPPTIVWPCCVGAKGGASKATRKQKASRTNGKRGGRPVGSKDRAPRVSRKRAVVR